MMNGTDRDMNRELVELAMRFLMRVQLTGQEVPAFNAVVDGLQRLVAQTPDDGAA